MTERRGDPAWQRLFRWMATLQDLSSATRMLDWDRETLMPPAGAAGRGDVVATLHALRHREVLADDIPDTIDAAASAADLTDAEQSLLALARRERMRAERMPEDLVRAQSAATSAAVGSWLEHRMTGDFDAYAPAFGRVVGIVREVGEALAIGDEAYDGLLDEYEPGMRAGTLEPMFAQIRDHVSGLLAGVTDTPAPTPFDRFAWPDDEQFALARDIAAMVGFRAESGLVARSAHPFTTSPHSGDVRFTTRIAPDEPTQNILATLHEVGHALYAQGRPLEHARTLLFSSPSLGADESQSRFFENHIGRSTAYWRQLTPVLIERFGLPAAAVDADAFAAAVRHTQRASCRIDADELSYDLHIALRFELELRLIRGEIAPSDVPEAWREAMRRLLGVEVADEAQGSMQDIHWAWGAFGYFPTYTLGNLYAAQLAEAAARELGPLDDLVARGEFAPITEFMRRRVHSQGRIWTTAELMRRATGEDFSLDPYLRRMDALAAEQRAR